MGKRPHSFLYLADLSFIHVITALILDGAFKMLNRVPEGHREIAIIVQQHSRWGAEKKMTAWHQSVPCRNGG
jgi:hypothetical protein